MNTDSQWSKQEACLHVRFRCGSMSNTTPVSHRPIDRFNIDQGNKRDDDQLANSSLPYYKHGGIVLLEEKLFSSPIDWQDMLVDFIHIVVVCILKRKRNATVFNPLFLPQG